MEKHDAEHDRSHSPDTRPHGIGGTDGQRMHGLCKQQHADDHTGEKARSPQIPLRTRSLFHLTQTECETRLKKSGNNQKKPILVENSSIVSPSTSSISALKVAQS